MDNIIKSEVIEPTMIYIIDKLLGQISEAKDNSDDYELHRACSNLWNTINCMDSIAIYCSYTNPSPIHFSLAISKTKNDMANYIEYLIGINPLEWERGNKPQKWI